MAPVYIMAATMPKPAEAAPPHKGDHCNAYPAQIHVPSPARHYGMRQARLKWRLSATKTDFIRPGPKRTVL